MGSLSSRPSVPTTAQTVLVSQPAVSTSTTTETNVDTSISGSSTDTLQSDTEARVDNLLRRSRGVTGTIVTGFRGLLSGNSSDDNRKSLLGE